MNLVPDLCMSGSTVKVDLSRLLINLSIHREHPAITAPWLVHLYHLYVHVCIVQFIDHILF